MAVPWTRETSGAPGIPLRCRMLQCNCRAMPVTVYNHRMEEGQQAPVIRDATLQDVAAITEIYHDAVCNTLATMDTDPPDSASRTEWLGRHGGRYPVLIAECSEVVVGWASLSVWIARGACRYTPEASVYVAASYRRRGIGRLLLLSPIGRAHTQHHVVVAQVIRDNDVSLDLLRDVGFRDSGLIQDADYKFWRWLDPCMLQFDLPYPPGTEPGA